MVLYAPQPFVDLSHGVGLNTRPLGYAARTGSPDRSPQMLIGLNSHFTFNALPDLEVFISGVVPSNKNAVQMPENGSVVFFEQADKVMKSENVLLFITDHIQAGASGFMLATMSDYIGLYSKRIGKALTAPLALYLRWSDSATAGMKIAGNAQSGRFWPRLHSPKAKTSMEIPTSSKTCGDFWRMNPRISGK